MSSEHLGFFRAIAHALGAATVRRLREGASHPSWPWLYEYTAAFLRTAAIDFEPLALAGARQQVAPVPFTLRRKVRLEMSQLGGRNVELYRTLSQHSAESTVLYLHGGGYVTCSPATHRDTIARIAYAAEARVVAPSYRLAPEHPYPAALEDVLSVYRALLQQGSSPERLFLGGDSAGGGLALALMLRLRDEGLALPRAAFLLSPWVDLSLSMESLAGLAPHDYLGPHRVVGNARAYAGMRPLTDPFVSPIYADLSGLPPLLVQTGGWELLHEQNRRLVARARAFGVDVTHHVEPGMLHAFTCFAGVLPQGKAALVQVAAFIRAQAALGPHVRPDSADVA